MARIQMPASTGIRTPGRAPITTRTLRTDPWWAFPASTFTVLLAFVVYATYAALANRDYYSDPYLSPLYRHVCPDTAGECRARTGHLTWGGSADGGSSHPR